MDDTLLTPDPASQIIAVNLKSLIEKGCYGQNDLSRELRKYGLRVNQGTISKYIKGENNIQLSVAMALCKIYEVSILDLLAEDFTYDGNSNTLISDIPRNKKNNDNDLESKIGEKLIIDPKNEHFEGYIQKYYCYFYPTISKERKLLTGKLVLEEKETYCQATFFLDTNKKKDGNNIIKEYSGLAIISKSVESFYIILSSPKEGELCVINLRHFSIRHQDLDCRMAVVITNGAGERHFPTVHRMLLSRVEIHKSHLKYLAPHFYLNSSDIRIKKEYLEKLEDKSSEYKELINHLLNKVEPTEIYDFKEDYVISNAKQFLSKEEARCFLSDLRNYSYKMRYNKVSNKLDETVRELLLSFGYYSDNSSEDDIE